MLGVSAWQMRRKQQVDAFRRTAVISLVLLLPAVTLNLFVGSELGVIEGTYQPMKIAAAEAHWNTCPAAARSRRPDRRRPQRRDPDPDHQHPRPALHPGHQPHRRGGAGNEPAQRAVPEGVRPGELHPQRLHSVLVDAGDGLPGHPGHGVRALGRLAALSPQARRVAAGSSASRPGWSILPVPDQHRRLDADRERAPALDRPGSHEDGERGLTIGVGHRHLDLPRRLLPDLHRVRRRRHLADDPLRPRAARPRPHRQDH